MRGHKDREQFDERDGADSGIKHFAEDVPHILPIYGHWIASLGWTM